MDLKLFGYYFNKNAHSRISIVIYLLIDFYVIILIFVLANNILGCFTVENHSIKVLAQISSIVDKPVITGEFCVLCSFCSIQKDQIMAIV